jgi:UDP-N-acetylmuramyl pentapeptide phosphotransferase/UDP-N-acetylglucosamine-1-phosphate transferase
MKSAGALFIGLVIGAALALTSQSGTTLTIAAGIAILGVVIWLISLVRYVKSSRYEIDRRVRSL